MAMKRCPVCGEKYSDTYRRCPFCEEEEALRSGDRPRRRQGGNRVARRGQSLLSPILIAAILVMAAVLIYLLFGDAIAKKLGRGQPADPVTSGDISAPAVSGGSSQGAAGSASGASSSAGASSSGAAPESAVALTEEDFTLKAGETHTLTVSDGSGSYTWESDDDGVASVSAEGVVTAIASGSATVTVSDGYTTDTCIVRVTGTASSGGTAKLSSQDVSIAVGESFTLSVTGTDASVVFDVDNSSVISVTEGGRVTGKALGRANVTATVNGQTLKCIVRVVR